jgi:hypothetical protein
MSQATSQDDNFLCPLCEKKNVDVQSVTFSSPLSAPPSSRVHSSTIQYVGQQIYSTPLKCSSSSSLPAISPSPLSFNSSPPYHKSPFVSSLQKFQSRLPTSLHQAQNSEQSEAGPASSAIPAPFFTQLQCECGFWLLLDDHNR